MMKIFSYIFMFINYPPLSIKASVVSLPDEINVGNLGKLPNDLIIQTVVVPEPQINVKITLKHVRPWYNPYLYGFLIPLSLGTLFISPFPA
jgi:hypothetical protein